MRVAGKSESDFVRAYKIQTANHGQALKGLIAVERIAREHLPTDGWNAAGFLVNGHSLPGVRFRSELRVNLRQSLDDDRGPPHFRRWHERCTLGIRRRLRLR